MMPIGHASLITGSREDYLLVVSGPRQGNAGHVHLAFRYAHTL